MWGLELGNREEWGEDARLRRAAAEGPPLGSEMALGQKQGLAWDRPSGHPIPRCHRRAGLSQLCLWVSDKAESSVPARGSLRAAHMPHSSLQIPG